MNLSKPRVVSKLNMGKVLTHQDAENPFRKTKALMTVGDDNDTLRMKVQPSPQVRATQSHLGKGVSSSSHKKI
jgi:hypothetical protein